MTELTFDLSSRGGRIKPMNAVNNGPTSPSVRLTYTNFDAYKAANIPFARNHDASFFAGYGGEHTVDVHRIFKNFDADENNPESYIFEPTDQYIKNTLNTGTKVFYRLGASIEHDYHYGTRVPKDFSKWARICEHIIRHYNEGWADGFNYGIEYWEIWNESDCRNADGSNPCWQGTEEEFTEFYTVAAKHLKKCFPNLKIGGPAFTSPWGEDKGRFLDSIVKNNTPLDFYSFHRYGNKIEDFTDAFKQGRNDLDERGLTNVPTILNEWNYVRGWMSDNWNYSLKTEKNLKGSAFVAGVMCAGQATPIDMLMYYDARPCGMNGLFKNETYECLKPYYSFIMFDALAQLGTHVPTEFCKDNLYNCAATDEKNYAAMISYFDDDAEDGEKEVKLSFANVNGKYRACCYLLDNEHDLDIVREEIFTASEFSIHLKMPLNTSVLIKLEKI